MAVTMAAALAAAADGRPPPDAAEQSGAGGVPEEHEDCEEGLDLFQRISAAQEEPNVAEGLKAAGGEADRRKEPAEVEGLKAAGGEAYRRKDWREALTCYTKALELCGPGAAAAGSEIALTCTNNRAACYAQLKMHAKVVEDASVVIEQQPANAKALLRRMVALEALGRGPDALKDASAVLTMEPKNLHALQVVAARRKALTKKGNEGLPKVASARRLCVFLFTEDRPLQCFSCLRSMRRHLRGAELQVYVFWQAKDKQCIHSYQLLQSLPADTPRLGVGAAQWIDSGGGQLFPAFSRTMSRLSVEGMQHVLFLSDTALFHTDVDVSLLLRVLDDRREVFSARLDVNPRIDDFPEASLLASAPQLQPFSGDPRVLLWTRFYEKSKQAFEEVPREQGWDAILDWTATIVRAEHVQHFFSALLPPLNCAREFDDKAADWLSRRQRMKRSELGHRSACLERPALVTLDPLGLAGGDAAGADRLLRGILLGLSGLDGSAGPERPKAFAEQLGWKLEEVMSYFESGDAIDADGKSSGSSPPKGLEGLKGLLEPECYRPHYLSSVRAPLAPPTTGLPSAPPAPAPLVSWLVPVRNAEAFVMDCLSSIEAQQGVASNAVEVVLVEDCSDDSTAAALRRLCAERPNWRVVENDQQLGVAGSLIEGWSHCRGDFVARLDADDEAEPRRLAEQLRYMERHRSISVLGARARPFWTELRKSTVERIVKDVGGRISVVSWREFHGNQTTRQREELVFVEEAKKVVVADGPAELKGAVVVRIGDEVISLNPEGWREALRGIQGGLGELVLQRRDPPEPSPAGGLRGPLHPLIVRATLPFDECLLGTTALLRRGHFAEECPFQREEAECSWTWLALGRSRHAANLADALVRARRYEGNRAQRDASGIYESRCAAVSQHFKEAYKETVDMHDAAAMINFRGPRTPEQGKKLLEVLSYAHKSLINIHVHGKGAEDSGDRERDEEFRKDFVLGREKALERALAALRERFEALTAEVSRVITGGDKSPRQHRSRTPPR